MGVEVIAGGTVNGCDSIINISLTFGDASVNDITQTICAGDSLIINGITYNEANPMGSDTIPNGSVAGCDSIINVMLSFFPLDTVELNQQLCAGDSLIVNGTTYNAANPSGLEILPGAGANGCDSIINVMLDFFPLDTVELNQQLCTGDSLVVNGTTYNASNPMGVEVIAGGTINGCDSIISISLTFGDASVNDIAQTICAGDSLIINGITYNEANPMGSDTIPNGSVAGCDSIINVMLSFFPLDTVELNQQLCAGDSLIVNGTTYNAANPSGLEILPGAGANGCDSIINVMLDFFSLDTVELNQQLCAGDSLVVNGTTYNASNPMGVEVIAGGTINGCDSIVNVMLSFFPLDTADITQQLCPGDSLIVNGATYNESNPSGIEVVIGGSANGCDSIINVMLSFFPLDTFELSQQLCTGDSLVINGTVYNASNPGGLEVIPAGSANGCDSIISVNLTFEDAVIEMITDTLCLGESVTVNGQVYDEQNPMGQEVIENGSAGGCDSIINVMLSFFPEIMGTLEGSTTICEGDSATLTIQLQGNDVYNVTISDGTSDIETFTNIMDGFTFTVLPTNTTTYTISDIVAIGNDCQADIGDGATVTVESTNVDVEVTSDFDGFGVSCSDSEDGSVLATTSADNVSYLWNTGATTSEIIGLGAGTYIVTVTTVAGCTAVDSAVLVAPNPIVTKIEGIEASCLDPLSGAVFIEAIAGGTPPYEFSLDGSFFQSIGDSSVIIPNVEPGTYDLIIQDVNDCQLTTQVFVGEAPELILELGDDEEIKLGDSLLLTPAVNFAVDEFFWSPFTGLSDSLSFTPMVGPTVTTTYQLTALDSLGCVVTDQLTVFVNTIGSVYVPTAFSPNEDGRNDFFTIFAGRDVEEVVIFRIFDRWGNMVFEAGPIEPNDETLGWDGNFNGEPMDPAVFVYYAEIRYVDGREEVIKGDITLIR
jgi:gliding motility-associated-like protein